MALELPEQAGPAALDSDSCLPWAGLSAELEERSFVVTGGVGQDIKES